MKFYDVKTKKTYIKKDGSEKTIWLDLGSMRMTDDGKYFLELNHMPNIPIYVFEQKPKEGQTTQQTQTAEPTGWE